MEFQYTAVLLLMDREIQAWVAEDLVRIPQVALGNLGVMSCNGQGCLRSLSALVRNNFTY